MGIEKTINDIYLDIIRDVFEHGQETSPRGMKVKELIGYSFTSDPRDNIITIPTLKTNVPYANEELRWYYSGTNSIHWSPHIRKIWEKYSDDGMHVNSAYGHRIFGRHHAFPDQWNWVKQKLREDPDSRQAVMNINYPGDKDKPTKDFPCTVYCQVFLRDGKLDWITNMRSNDVYFGLRNDMYCFTEMQKRMASELDVEPGMYHHFAGSMHLYEPQFEKVKKVLYK